MKNATDAMKEARIADFLASVGALTMVLAVFYIIMFLILITTVYFSAA